jgi:hypothetical protein
MDARRQLFAHGSNTLPSVALKITSNFPVQMVSRPPLGVDAFAVLVATH